MHKTTVRHPRQSHRSHNSSLAATRTPRSRQLGSLAEGDSESRPTHIEIADYFAAAKWVSRPSATNICQVFGADTDQTSAGNDTVSVLSDAAPSFLEFVAARRDGFTSSLDSIQPDPINLTNTPDRRTF